MKVLFVISSLNTGGAQRVLSNIVTNMPEDEWEIDILLNSARNIEFPYRGNLIDLNILEPSNRRNIGYQLHVFVKRYLTLKKLKKKEEYNTCISFLGSANIVNVVTGKNYCKTITTIHSTLSKDKSLVGRCLNNISKFFYNRANHVVAVSKGVKNDLIHNLGIRSEIITTIYNGFDIDNIRKHAGNRQNNQLFTFVTMGRLEQPKGQWHLIRAFAELEKRYSNCQLVILGEGSLYEYNKQLIENYQIKEKVLLKGFVSNPFSELMNADVFVLPSLWEGMPMVIIEAMVCGLPIISTDFRSGAREILAPDTDIEFEQKTDIEFAKYGIITPVCSGIKHSAEQPLEPQELILLKAMELMYTNEDIRNQYRRISPTRAKDFSIEHSIKQWCKLME